MSVQLLKDFDPFKKGMLAIVCSDGNGCWVLEKHSFRIKVGAIDGIDFSFV
jgi:hypothetical protein